MVSNTCAMTLAQRSDRILAQTRGLSGATPNATQLIEEMRSALEAYRQENATLTDEIELLRSTVTDCNIEIEQLRKERDEARRMACLQSCMGDDEPREWSPEDFAKQHGWDCFQQEETK